MKKTMIVIAVFAGFFSVAFAETALPQLALFSGGTDVSVPAVSQAQKVAIPLAVKKDHPTRTYISNSGYTQENATKELNALVSRLNNAGVEVVSSSIMNAAPSWYFTVEYKSKWLSKDQTRYYDSGSLAGVERYFSEKAGWESRNDLVILEVINSDSDGSELNFWVKIYYLPLIKGASVFE